MTDHGRFLAGKTDPVTSETGQVTKDEDRITSEEDHLTIEKDHATTDLDEERVSAVGSPVPSLALSLQQEMDLPGVAVTAEAGAARAIALVDCAHSVW